MTKKTALITGAASGIGRACAIRMASEGRRVGVLDVDLAGCQAVVDDITAAGGEAIALQASIADRAAVEAAVAQLRDAFGPVLILVNNAGIAPFKRFEEITDDEWDQVFTINAKGTFIVSQVCTPDMKAAGWGRIINISSSSAQTGSVDQVHYSATKGAVMAMTKSMSQALAPHGITVNNVPPGAVAGTKMFEAGKESFKMDLDMLKRMIPVGRMGVADDIANAVSWLASEDSGYVSGQTIGINGGRIAS